MCVKPDGAVTHLLKLLSAHDPVILPDGVLGLGEGHAAGASLDLSGLVHLRAVLVN